MKKPDINTMMQLLGLIGVAASLIFVGLELRESQQIAMTGPVQARNQAFLDLYTTAIGEEQIGGSLFADGYQKLAGDPIDLSEAEYGVWNFFKSRQVMSSQNAFQQYEMGLLPKSVWEQISFRIQAQYSSCYLRPIFSLVSYSIDDDLSTSTFPGLCFGDS